MVDDSLRAGMMTETSRPDSGWASDQTGSAAGKAGEGKKGKEPGQSRQQVHRVGKAQQRAPRLLH